jgi:hypothetical protein
MPSPCAIAPSTWPFGQRRVEHGAAVDHGGEFEHGDGAGRRVDLDLGRLGDEVVGAGLVPVPELIGKF